RWHALLLSSTRGASLFGSARENSYSRRSLTVTTSASSRVLGQSRVMRRTPPPLRGGVHKCAPFLRTPHHLRRSPCPCRESTDALASSQPSSTRGVNRMPRFRP